MIISGANFTAGPVLAQQAEVTGLGQQQINVSNSPDLATKFVAPAPSASMSYTGRVGTFYSGTRASYSETYEPGRQTSYGPISRIESRVVGGRWMHVAYRLSGEPVLNGADDIVLFDESSLPLMFAPPEEIKFAKTWLSTIPAKEVVNLPNSLVVYGNRERSSLGIIRLKLSV